MAPWQTPPKPVGYGGAALPSSGTCWPPCRGNLCLAELWTSSLRAGGVGGLQHATATSATLWPPLRPRGGSADRTGLALLGTPVLNWSGELHASLP